MNEKGLIIGIGAAGNKSVINLIEKGVVEADDTMLINSTLNDIPAKYKASAYILNVNTGGGCGKERTKSKDAMIEALRDDKINIKQKCADGDYNFIAIVSSTEGGTGSGASTMLGLYCHTVIKLPVHMFAFIGFGTDPRGLQNTMEYFEDLEKGVIMNIIRNDKYLRETGSQCKSELAANDELAKQIKVLTGQVIVEGNQNIDPRDIYKAANTPGYQIVEYLELTEKIRNKSDFEQQLIKMCDESHAMDTKPSMLRLAVITNVSESSQVYCEDFSVLHERYGNAYEVYPHRQSEPGGEFIAFIASGMKMPMDEIKEIYDSYSAASEAVDKSEDDFFDQVKSLKGNPKDAMFTMTSEIINSGSEDDFFSKFQKKGDGPKVLPVTPVEEY